jgi:hypothetical protein
MEQNKRCITKLKGAESREEFIGNFPAKFKFKLKLVSSILFVFQGMSSNWEK